MRLGAYACRSPYAQIVGIGTNNDGFTDKGITFPSGEAQRELGTSVRKPALAAVDFIIHFTVIYTKVLTYSKR